jgi:Bacterial Ig-like domain (group 3)
MRTSRPQVAATNRAESTSAVRARLSSGAIRLLSVTAVAATMSMLWAGAASASTAQPHAKYATTTKITNKNPGSVQVHKAFTFHVTVTSPAGAPAATGTVRVFSPGASGSYDCTATLSGGKGSCSITAPEYGVVKYEATYSGNATHSGSTYTGPYNLEMKNFTTTTAGPATATAGSVTLTAEVYAMGADIDHAAGGTGSMAFYVGTSPTGNPATACPAQLLTSFNPSTGDNEATCVYKLAAGTYYLTDKFSGDETNEPSNSKTVKLVVS